MHFLQVTKCILDYEFTQVTAILVVDITHEEDEVEEGEDPLGEAGSAISHHSSSSSSSFGAVVIKLISAAIVPAARSLATLLFSPIVWDSLFAARDRESDEDYVVISAGAVPHVPGTTSVRIASLGPPERAKSGDLFHCVFHMV